MSATAPIPSLLAGAVTCRPCPALATALPSIDVNTNVCCALTAGAGVGTENATYVLDLAALSSASIGTLAFMLGLLMFFRCRAPGYGWSFPIAITMVLAGLVNTAHSMSLLSSVQPWISPVFSRPLETSFVDLLLVIGFLAAWYRVRRQLLTNSIVPWTFVMLVACYLSSWLLWNIHMNAQRIFEASSFLPNGMLVTSLVLPLILLALAFVFKRIDTFYVFLPVYAVGSLLSNYGFAQNYSMHLIGEVTRFAAYFWLFYWLANTNSKETPHGVVHDCSDADTSSDPDQTEV